MTIVSFFYFDKENYKVLVWLVKGMVEANTYYISLCTIGLSLIYGNVLMFIEISKRFGKK